MGPGRGDEDQSTQRTAEYGREGREEGGGGGWEGGGGVGAEKLPEAAAGFEAGDYKELGAPLSPLKWIHHLSLLRASPAAVDCCALLCVSG